MIGKIVKGIGGFYYVKAAGEIFECKARGIFRKNGIKPYIGDDVKITVSGGKGSIDEILPRRNSLIRPPVANIDTLVVVIAAANPSPDLFLVDKLLVSAEHCGITPVVVINKTDLRDGSELCDLYRSAGYTAMTVCAEKKEGTDALVPILKGKNAAFSGLSGVGKSTILNTLTGGNMETGAVSDKIKRGRHTTRHVELIETDYGGYLFDTPGFGSFDVAGIKKEELDSLFPEMRGVSDNCRFKGCSHINEPNCAVKEKAAEGKIVESRYNSYRELYNQLKNIKEWEK